MKEQIVANSGQNFYAESGGNLMADSVSRSEIGKTGEGSSRGEIKPGDISGARSELDKEGILGNLESNKRVMEEALRAMGAELPEFDRKQDEIESGIGVTERKSGTKEPITIATFPHLVNSDKDEVNKRLKEKGLDFKVPDEWEKWGILQRGQWLSSHDIFNVTKLPVEKTVDLRKRVIPRIAGAATRWTSEQINAMKTPDDVLGNLELLVDNERRLGSAEFERQSGNGDRRELHDRLRALRVRDRDIVASDMRHLSLSFIKHSRVN